MFKEIKDGIQKNKQGARDIRNVQVDLGKKIEYQEILKNCM